MRPPLPKAAALALVLCAVALSARPPIAAASALDKNEATPREVETRRQLAKVWTDFAHWCADHGQKSAGREALAAAVAAGLPDKSASPIAKSLDDAAEKSEDPGLAAKRKETAVAAAKVHAKLFDLALNAKSGERADAALAAELALDPTAKSVKQDFGQLLHVALESNWNEVAGRWLARAKSVDPEAYAAGKFKEPQLALGKKDVMLLGGGSHPLVAYVSLPPTWTPAKKNLAVVVAVEGAGCNFAGACRMYRDSRGTHEAIVVTPCSFSNTNELVAAKYPWYDAAILNDYASPNGSRPAGEGSATRTAPSHGASRVDFDAAGLAAVLDELRRDWGASDRIAITGFSGGGNLCYWWTFQHPEQLTLAVGSCANFNGMGVQGAKPPSDGGPPVLLLTGEKDDYNLEVNGQKPGIVGQTDHAEAELSRLGFTRVTRRVVPGAGHSNFAAEVWKLL